MRSTAMIRSFLFRYPLMSMVIIAAFVIGIGLMMFGDQQGDDRFQIAAADEPLIATKHDERLLALDREAVDNAYRDQVEHLIQIWFKDESGQPARAINGVRIARKRYIDIQ